MNKIKEIDALPDSLLILMYRNMVRIRNFEHAARRLYMEGKLPGFMHMSVGQEATSVGVCSALRDDDYITTTHRGHGDVLAKGVSFDSAMAELFAKSTGICKGKGGSMHIADLKKNIFGANGIVSAGIPIALGAAFSTRYRKTDQVTVSFFGDGASAGGPLHESMNMAALWKLPILFVRENNQYAESTPQADFQGIPDMVKWAEGYGMPAYRVDGNNVIEVHLVTKEAVARAREGKGPTFIESMTYRWYGHNMGDPGTWRPQAEVDAWKAKDPIAQHKKYLIDNELVPASKLDEIGVEEEKLTEEAIQKAEKAPPPPLSSVFDGLYVDVNLGKQAIQGTENE
jgi:acetoin:2,6-dichlorophenolindophenol oxidoreductase subunit alpha